MRIRNSLRITAIATVLLSGCTEQPAPGPQQDVGLYTFVPSQTQAEAIYDYAYPLVIMKISQDLMLTAPFRPPSTPNHFIHFANLAQPQNKAVVLGNRNTLYSVGWLDLSQGPVLFEIPDMGDRYYVMPLLDAWTNTFRSLGSRTTGQAAQKYLIANERDAEQTLEGYETIVAPTNMVWITGRIQADSPQDALGAALLQGQYRLLTLREHRDGADPYADYQAEFSFAEVRLPVPYTLEMPAAAFFETFQKQWANNPSPPADAEMLALLAEFGWTPEAASWAELPTPVREALAEGARAKQSAYRDAFYKGRAQADGWTFIPNGWEPGVPTMPDGPTGHVGAWRQPGRRRGVRCYPA